MPALQLLIINRGRGINHCIMFNFNRRMIGGIHLASLGIVGAIRILRLLCVHLSSANGAKYTSLV